MRTHLERLGDYFIQEPGCALPAELVEKLRRSTHAERFQPVLDAERPWRAYKVSWVEEHEKGPDDKPFNTQVRLTAGQGGLTTAGA